MTGVTVSRFHAKVSPGNLMISKRCIKRSLGATKNDSRYASVAQIARLESPGQVCEKWTLAWCRTKDKIQQHLTTHTYFLVTLATYICDVVHNIW